MIGIGCSAPDTAMTFLNQCMNNHALRHKYPNSPVVLYNKTDILTPLSIVTLYSISQRDREVMEILALGAGLITSKAADIIDSASSPLC
jgi:hypothetical protein